MLLGCVLLSVVVTVCSQPSGCVESVHEVPPDADEYYFVVTNKSDDLVIENKYRLLVRSLQGGESVVVGDSAKGMGAVVLRYKSDNTSEVISTCNLPAHYLFSKPNRKHRRNLEFTCGPDYDRSRGFVVAKTAADVNSHWQDGSCFSSSRDLAVWIRGNSEAAPDEDLAKLFSEVFVESAYPVVSNAQRYMLYVCATAGFLLGELAIVISIRLLLRFTQNKRSTSSVASRR